MTQPVRRSLRSRLARSPAGCAVFATTILAAGATSAADLALDRDLDARVAHAQQFVSAKLFAKVRNSGVVFRWIGDSDRFWFRKTSETGATGFVVVDAATGRQAPLFDTDAMTAALVKVGVKAGTPIANIDVQNDGLSVVVAVAAAQPGSGSAYLCDLPVTSCQIRPAWLGADYLVSPDRRQAVFAREHNLWVKDLKTGAERQLTREGVEHFAYGETHFHHDTARVSRRRAGLPNPLLGLSWSPDSRLLLAIRHDLRNVPDRLVVTEYLPPEGGRPVVHTARLAIASDAKYPDATVDVIDVASGAVRRTKADPQGFGDVTAFLYSGGQIWWSKDNSLVSLLSYKRGGLEVRLVQIDTRTGEARDAVVETAKTQILAEYDLKSPTKMLYATHEAIWFSSRDGWRHLYLYDTATGRLKRQLTKGSWAVTELIGIDEAKRTVYFTAAGKEPGRNPYYRHLYSVGFDGGEPRLITPENADHEFAINFIFGGTQGGSMSPSGRYFIDSYSTTSTPDKVVLKTIAGRPIAEVVSADISALVASGWRAPEPYSAKAADGTTDLYGVIIKPQNFDPSKKYPVIEVTYPGPAARFAPTTFRDDFLQSTTLNAHAFAEAGAVVITVEGRGGGMRSAAFETAFRGTDDMFGAADHVAAIRNAAATRPYMDLTRVGVTGHSYGGYSSLRSMLLFPDFYKVGVSGEGPGDWLVSSLDVGTERLLGIPTDPATLDYYRRISNESLAARLDGKLLLIFAGLDENVPFQSAFQLTQALNKANKVYDTLIMPDAAHFGGREPYGVMRTIRYFAENLGGPE